MSSRSQLALRGSSGLCRIRRRTLLGLTLCGLLAATGVAHAARVPASVQASLVAKIASFDRNFAARAGSKAIVLVVRAPDDPESAHDATAFKAALGNIPKVGNVPHEEIIITYSSAAALAAQVRSRKAAVVYFGSGFSGQIAAIRREFSALDVLTFGADADYVPAGIVVGVDLVSGRPKLSVNLTQARKQNVSFPAAVLNLMKVHR